MQSMNRSGEQGVRCMILRGGTSKGAYFLADDLPADVETRNRLLMRIMGTPDPRQIDGIGGATPLTSKVAVVSLSAPGSGAEIDYLFLQLGVDEPMVTDRQNCGNLLAGVGPFAVERGLITTPESATATTVRIRMLNTDSIAAATFPVAAGRPVYDGETAISGVPGTAATIRLDFEGVAGGSCGALLPTGSPVDEIDGVACTLIDNGMPVVVMTAADLGVTGHESCDELESNTALRHRLESIRLQAGPLMNLGPVNDTSVPKLTMVSAPRHGGHFNTRTFIPHRCHEAIGVLGAVSVATAALVPGSPASSAMARPADSGVITVEHPTGSFEAAIDATVNVDGVPEVRSAGIIRTARKLFDGTAFPREYR
jgi:4-oxalomesaconate tautomerase